MDGNTGDFTELKGFCIDLLELIVEKFPYVNYSIQFVKDGAYGTLKDGEWNGMIGELIRGEADMVLAGLTITSLRQEYVLFTKPFMNADLGFVIKAPEANISWYGYLYVFDFSVWLLLIASLTFFSVIVWFVSDIDSENSKIMDCAMNTISVMAAQGPVIALKNIAGKITCTFLWVFSLMVVTYFTAKLTANFTTQSLESRPGSIEELLKYPKYSFGTTNNGAVYSVFKHSHYNAFQKLYNIMSNSLISPFVNSTRNGVKRSRQNGKYAFISESPFLQSHVLRNPCDLDMYVSPQSPTTGGGYGLAFRKDESEITLLFSQRIIELHENGQLSALRKRWWDDRNECPKREFNIEEDQRPISLLQTAGLFMILCVGAIVGIIAKYTEKLVKTTCLTFSKKSNVVSAIKHN